MKKLQKGFTLIELLVVIAIIGILSSVVLASLNTARNKGADAAVRSNLANARAQAELYYDSNTNSYDNGTQRVCDVDIVGGPKSILANIANAKLAIGLATATGRDAIGSLTVATCNDTAAGWAVEVPLRSTTVASVYCVDSTGASQVNTATGLSATSDVTCN